MVSGFIHNKLLCQYHKHYSSEHEHNFNKYGEDEVTDFGVAYDYLSAMHYSQHAFDINDEIPTIFTKVV